MRPASCQQCTNLTVFNAHSDTLPIGAYIFRQNYFATYWFSVNWSLIYYTSISSFVQ